MQRFLSHFLFVGLAALLGGAVALLSGAAPPTPAGRELEADLARIDAEYRERFAPLESSVIYCRATRRTMPPDYLALREEHRRALVAAYQSHKAIPPAHIRDWEDYSIASIEKAINTPRISAIDRVTQPVNPRQ